MKSNSHSQHINRNCITLTIFPTDTFAHRLKEVGIMILIYLSNLWKCKLQTEVYVQFYHRVNSFPHAYFEVWDKNQSIGQ
jgi:hypothetical protein